MSEIRVAVLGPKGTYTEKVALDQFEKPELLYCKDNSEVFRRMDNGEADNGVVAIEDSAEGDVTVSLDLLRDYDFFIIGEAFTEVTHALLAKKDEKSLTKIGSHPQALRHCRRYLETYFPDLEQRPEASTAFAAKKAAKDDTFGAIADERNADIYGLNVLRTEIHDWGSNLTRFFILSKEPKIPTTGPAKTSIIVYPRDDEPRQLYHVLRELSERSINLTKIVSRPARGRMDEYIFYMDFEGNQTDPDVKTALETIENLDEVRVLRILGSYPYQPKMVEETVEEQTPQDLIIQTYDFWDNPEDSIYETL